MTAIPPAPGDDYPGQMQGESPMTTFNTLRQTQAFPGEVLDVGSERESARACSTRFELQEIVHEMS